MTDEHTLAPSSLIELGMGARRLTVSKFAPIVLLILTIGLLDAGLATTPASVRLGAVGILPATGILGALLQNSVAGETLVVIGDLDAAVAPSAMSRGIVASRPRIVVPRAVTPAILVLVALVVTI